MEILFPVVIATAIVIAVTASILCVKNAIEAHKAWKESKK